MVNLSESLARVPGLVVNNRHNYAQDLQISSRGFGARAAFGVRGVRLYSDGIPATMPDGQGQVSHFDLAGAERIEVLRGPFSALYGNSSGGVIALFTRAGAQARAARRRWTPAASACAGARLACHAAGVATAYAQLGGAAMRIDGFRPHSEARARSCSRCAAAGEGERDRVTLHAQRASTSRRRTRWA